MRAAAWIEGLTATVVTAGLLDANETEAPDRSTASTGSRTELVRQDAAPSSENARVEGFDALPTLSEHVTEELQSGSRSD